MNTFTINFENGLPKGTAQQKGEAIQYRNGVPYIQHYKKDKVSAMRQEFVLRLKRHAPKHPTEKPVFLRVWLCFSVTKKELWGKYKTTRPDADGYIKEFLDAMTDCGFWLDDAQVCRLEIIKTYAERAAITITFGELEEIRKVQA